MKHKSTEHNVTETQRTQTERHTARRVTITGNPSPTALHRTLRNGGLSDTDARSIVDAYRSTRSR